MTPTTILIDADIVAFKASSVTEGVWHFNGKDEPPAVESDLGEALRKAKDDIEVFADTLKATSVVVCLTDDANFRLDVYPPYKGHRAGKRRPENLRAVKDFMAKHYQTYQRPGLEADDCMGILATHPTLIKGKAIMVSEDKDMKTVPAWLFNPRKDKAARKVTEVEALRFHMEQTLTGDSTDGYPGCPGIGIKSPFVTAVREAKTYREAWEIVVAGYESKGYTAEDALVQARCARILQSRDWDFTLKAPRLWTPPAPK